MFNLKIEKKITINLFDNRMSNAETYNFQIKLIPFLPRALFAFSFNYELLFLKSCYVKSGQNRNSIFSLLSCSSLFSSVVEQMMILMKSYFVFVVVVSQWISFNNLFYSIQIITRGRSGRVELKLEVI